jgi:hypothetical protein
MRWFASCCALLAIIASAQQPDELRFRVRAGFMYKFLSYMDWPADSQPDGNTVFCIMGDDPFGGIIDEMGKLKVDGRGIEIWRISSLEAVPAGAVLYIYDISRQDLQTLAPQAADKRVLLIGEGAEFLKHGGLIAFFEQQNRVRFSIHSERAEKQGFSISSRLLRIAVGSGH